jgi:hypothetical protein
MGDELEKLVSRLYFAVCTEASAGSREAALLTLDAENAIRSHVAAMVAAERERCARVCERLARDALFIVRYSNDPDKTMLVTASEIRRGE